MGVVSSADEIHRHVEGGKSTRMKSNNDAHLAKLTHTSAASARGPGSIITRRTLLTLGSAVVISELLETGPARAARGRPPVMMQNRYRPIPLIDARALPHFPTDANPVLWHWSRRSGMTIQDAVETLGERDILILPEDEKPYTIDSSRGFQRTRRNFHSMVAVRRGIAGLGPNAVIEPSPSAFSAPRQVYTHGMREKMIESRSPGAYFGNFTMRGHDFGGIGYNATWASGAGTTWERIYFRGAHRGWKSSPPGEAGAICGYRGTGMRAYNIEVDCRDQYGVSVGTSPLMWNAQSNVEVTDVYAHHAYAGMPTWWRVSSAKTTRLIHRDMAQGVAEAPGVNVEDCWGHHVFDNCTLLLDYGPNNRGMHLQSGSPSSSIVFDIRAPIIDAGRWPGFFSIQESRGSPQRDSDIHITRADGSAYPFRIAG